MTRHAPHPSAPAGPRRAPARTHGTRVPKHDGMTECGAVGQPRVLHHFKLGPLADLRRRMQANLLPVVSAPMGDPLSAERAASAKAEANRVRARRVAWKAGAWLVGAWIFGALAVACPFAMAALVAVGPFGGGWWLAAFAVLALAACACAEEREKVLDAEVGRG